MYICPVSLCVVSSHRVHTPLPSGQLHRQVHRREGDSCPRIKREATCDTDGFCLSKMRVDVRAGMYDWRRHMCAWLDMDSGTDVKMRRGPSLTRSVRIACYLLLCRYSPTESLLLPKRAPPLGVGPRYLYLNGPHHSQPPSIIKRYRLPETDMMEHGTLFFIDKHRHVSFM